MLSVMGEKGPSSITVEKVGLITVSDATPIGYGKLTDLGTGDILVTVDAVPAGEFVIILTGTDKVSNSEFQRQSTTQMSVSKVYIQVCACLCLTCISMIQFIKTMTCCVILKLCSLPFFHFDTRLWWTAVWSQGKP